MFGSTTCQPRAAERASVPVVGTVLLIALTVFVALVMTSTLLGVGSTAEPTPTAAIDLEVDGNTLTMSHDHGDPLNVTAISIRITVDGEPLDEQPPVPFFAASGFESGPTGPFNAASDNEWQVGRTASLTVADTNQPTLESGSTVSVKITTDDGAVIQTETTV